MQSFAIWHDAEHTFHAEDEQCERFEAFAHNPPLDIVVQIAVISARQTGIIALIQPIALLQLKQREAHAIRAPPALFS